MSSSSNTTASLDRRGCERISCRKPVKIWPVTYLPDDAFTLHTDDMSVDGMFLNTELLLDVGEWISLEIDVPGRSRPLRRNGQVVRVECDADAHRFGFAVHLED